MIEHDYMTMKLTNGDNIICVVLGEDDTKFTIMYPIAMKTTRVEVGNMSKEVLAGGPWCPFTDDTIFEIFKQDVILIKPLNDSTLVYYKNMIDMSELEEDYEPDSEETNEETVYDDRVILKGNNTIN